MLVLILAVGWWRKSDDVIRVSLWLIALLAVAAIAIKFTGDFAFEQSPEKFETVKDLVSRHEQAGDQVTTAVFLLGLAAGLALFLARWKGPIRSWTIALVLLCGIVTALLYIRSAHSGGQISHPELRPHGSLTL